MDITLITLTLISVSFGFMSLGYAWGVSRQLRKLECAMMKQPIRKVRGQSDVCKDEDWMPFGEVAR